MANKYSKLFKVLDLPGAATRAATKAFIEDQPVLESAQKQLNLNEEAPSGYDIAEKIGEKYNIEDPYALATISTLAEVGLDPTNLIPGKAFGKIAQLVDKTGLLKKGLTFGSPGKLSEKGPRTILDQGAGKILVKDIQEEPKKFGKTIILP